MTTVITRYFDSEKKLAAARRELVYARRFPPSVLSVHDDADTLVDALTAASVRQDTATAYRDRLGQGGAVLMVRADYRPLGAARIAREVLAHHGATDMPGIVEEVTVREPRKPVQSVLRYHPLVMTPLRDPDSTSYHMANWPIPLISRRKPYRSTVFPRHARMAAWPIGLLVPGNRFMAKFPFAHIVPGHKFMAKFPFAHIVPGHKHMAGFPFGHIVPGHKFMAKFPFAHIVPGHKHMAGWPIKHLVPGHRRMANWPFPLLINGEQHTNSLVPGNKFMAKFPFAHIVPGHKFMAKFPFAHIVPGHKHMAKFPFAHIVPGHKHMAGVPFGHIVPGNKFMANWIWPHYRPKAG